MLPLTSDKKAQLHGFITRRRLAALAYDGPRGGPQAALMNIAVTPDLEIVFETTCYTRKFMPLERDPRVALVIGWDGQETLQYEGMATRPEGRGRELARDTFVAAFPRKAPDEFWPGNAYFLVRPCWLRFSSYYQPRFTEEYFLEERRAPDTGWRGRLARLVTGNPDCD
ncbi:MAG TPA: pyridoxamine 5'-phosphate oxidase family protein [Rhizomicrobium sp.]|nr:pyridoxamine 5'-phosphate oxidase family protein [Rhizomicrobium sp.]